MSKEKLNFNFLRGNHVLNYGIPYLILAPEEYDNNAYQNSVEFFLFFDENPDIILALRLNSDLRDRDQLNRLKIVNGDYLQHEIRRIAEVHLRSFCDCQYLKTDRRAYIDYVINFEEIDIQHDFVRLFFYEKHRTLLKKIAAYTQVRNLRDFIQHNLDQPVIFKEENLSMEK